MENEEITHVHHYTTIENLALILKSQKIRFSRLDLLDDIKETDGLDQHPYNFDKSIFISSWTEDEEENIPLWKMYASIDNGVRITMPRDMFKKQIIEKFSTDNHGIMQDIASPFTKDETFYNGKYCIMNVFNFEKKDFYKKVEYKDNFIELYKSKIKIVEKELIVNRLWDLGKYKSTKWEFQKECRFTLYTKCLNPEHKNNPHKQYDSGSISLWNENPDKYIFVPLDEDVMKKMIITLAPCVTEAQKIIVGSLRDKYCQGATINESSLKGDIRK